MRRHIMRAQVCKGTGHWEYGHFVYEEEEYTWFLELDGCCSEILVDMDTAGAYTLFRDKNGVKVFEKDIVSFPRDKWGEDGKFLGEETASGVVIFDKDTGYKVLLKKGKFVTLDCLDEDKVEVVGNIFDNPDLASWYVKDAK